MSNVTTNLFGRRADDTFTVERSGKIFRQHGAPIATFGHVGNWAVDVDKTPFDLWHKVRPWPESLNVNVTIGVVQQGVNGDEQALTMNPAGTRFQPNSWAIVGAMLSNTDPVALALKWYSDARLDNTIGDVGDYAVFTGREAAPLIWGPKTATGWPENGDGPTLDLGTPVSSYTPRGVSGDGTDIAIDMTTLTTSSTTGTSGVVSTITVTTTTNQQVPFWLRGLLGDVGSVLGAALDAVTEHGVETWGAVFNGTFTPSY